MCGGKGPSYVFLTLLLLLLLLMSCLPNQKDSLFPLFFLGWWVFCLGIFKDSLRFLDLLGCWWTVVVSHPWERMSDRRESLGHSRHGQAEVLPATQTHRRQSVVRIDKSQPKGPLLRFANHLSFCFVLGTVLYGTVSLVSHVPLACKLWASISPLVEQLR